MKIKFKKEFRFINPTNDGYNSASDCTFGAGKTVDEPNDESAQWLIDNGFAEEVKESGWWKPVGVILFDSEAHADRSLRKHPDEWKTIVNYDWSRE